MTQRAGTPFGVVLMLLTTIGWAGAWISARWAAHDAPALWVAVGRFTVAAACLVPAWWVWGRGARLDRDTWLTLGAMALTGAIGYNLFFLWGIQYAPASDGAIVTPGLAGLASVVVAYLWTGDKPTRRAVAGGLLALTGCLLLGSQAFTDGVDRERALGIACFAASSAVWGIYTNLSKRISHVVPAVTGVLASSAIAAVLLAPIAWLASGAPAVTVWPASAWWNILYLGGVATAIAFVTYYAGVQRLGIGRAAPWLGMVPVWGVTGAWLLLGETVTVWHVVGGAVVVAGIVVPSKQRKRP